MGIVYKLFCLDSDIKEFYIGSSKKFKRRKYEHKSRCNNENSDRYNLKVYKFIRANGGYNNFDYEILLKTEDDNDIKILEQKYIDELKPTLNRYNACGLDIKEYRLNNKEKLSKQKKLYYKNNKEKMKDSSRLYRLKNKEKISKQKKEQYRLKKSNNLNV